MATPLIHELRLNYPKSKIDVLVMQGEICRDLLKNNKDIDNLIYFNFMKKGFLKSFLFCNKLNKERYDLSINCYPQSRLHYSFVSYLIHARKRIGFNYETQKLKVNKIIFTDTINENFSEHVVYNNLKVLDLLGLKRKKKNPKLIFNLARNDKNFADLYFKKNRIKKAVSIHAGSGTTKNFVLKRWPKERFALLCKEIRERDRFKIILMGGEEENELKRWIIKNSGLKEGKEIFNLNADINKTSAIIKKSVMVISNDTIIGHIAAALDVPIISLFGPTSPRNTAPFTEKKIVLHKNPENVELWKHGRKGISKKQASLIYNIRVRDVYEAFKNLENKIKEDEKKI